LKVTTKTAIVMTAEQKAIDTIIRGKTPPNGI